MKTLVVYDSRYGDTEKIAQSIAEGVGTAAKSIISLLPTEISVAELIFVGSPTQAGRPTEAMQEFMNNLPLLEGVGVAAFDTHLKQKWVGIFGHAAPRIASKLSDLGAAVVAEPEGFLVAGKEGPLLQGELERAKIWGEKIKQEWSLA